MAAMSKRWDVITLMAIALGFVVLGWFLEYRPPVRPRPAPAILRQPVVTYTVTGTAPATITCQTPGGTCQLGSVRLPWQRSFRAKWGQFLYLSAQVEGTGRVTVSIVADGKRLPGVTSAGSGVIASTSGTL